MIHGGRLDLVEDMYFMVSREMGWMSVVNGLTLTWMSSGVGVLAGVMEVG